MKKLLSCALNMYTARVELRFSDRSMRSIDTIAVENEIVDNMYQRSELNYQEAMEVVSINIWYCDVSGLPVLGGRMTRTTNDFDETPAEHRIHDARRGLSVFGMVSASCLCLRRIGDSYIIYSAEFYFRGGADHRTCIKSTKGGG